MNNEEIIQNYLNFYKHSKQSVKMRRSSLKYFFDKYGYNGDIFDISTRDLKQYFIWLKNLDTINKQTKRNKWNILTSFLNFTMEDYPEEFLIKIPSKTISWNGTVPKNGGVQSNKDVYANIEELEKILDYFKKWNFEYYLIFRLLAETGMRKGELINMKISDLHLGEYYIHLYKGKTDEKYYIITKSLANLMKIHLEMRTKYNVKTKKFFLSERLTDFHNKSLNIILKKALNKIGIKKNITCHTFRRTLNDYRKQMGAPKEDRKMLVGHKVTDVNVKSYTRSDIIRLKTLFDKWNPYKDSKF